MSIPIHEELNTLAGFYPDAALRERLHYHFTHQFLVWYVHDNPPNFVMHDGVDPTRFIHTRWTMMEQMTGLQSRDFLPDGGLLLRRVKGLEAWEQEVAGHPALFVQMPVPESPSLAFFSAAVLLAPTDVFRKVEASTRSYVEAGGECPAESDVAALRAAGARFFTLERSYIYEGEQALQIGRLCEWTAANEHRNSGLAVPVAREGFASAVAEMMQVDGQIPAVASHKPATESSSAVLTIMVPSGSPPPPPSSVSRKGWWKFW